MVQNVLEDVFALTRRQIVEKILWCHLSEPRMREDDIGKKQTNLCRM